MKQIAKMFCLAGLLAGAALAGAEQFQIGEVFYDIEGMTKQYAVELNIEIATNRIFHSQEEFDAAETLHKQELAIDLRVQDIIRHTAISKNIPNLP